MRRERRSNNTNKVWIYYGLELAIIGILAYVLYVIFNSNVVSVAFFLIAMVKPTNSLGIFLNRCSINKSYTKLRK